MIRIGASSSATAHFPQAAFGVPQLGRPGADPITALNRLTLRLLWQWNAPCTRGQAHLQLHG